MDSSIKICRKYIIIFFSLLIFPPPSPAVAEWSLGASLAVIEEYDSNVFLTPEDEASDMSTLIEPGLSFFWSGKRHSLNLDYESSLLYYRDLTGANRSRHLGEGEVELSLPARSTLKLEVVDEYEFFQRDIREAEATRNRSEGNELDIKPTLEFRRFEPVYLEAGYRYQRRDYRELEDGVDWKGRGPNFSLGIKLMPELDISLIYQHHDVNFTSNPNFSTVNENYEDDTAGVRLRSEISDRLAGEVSWSRLWREYRSGRDFKSYVVEGELTLQVLDNTLLELNYSQLFLEQVGGEPYKNREGDVMVIHTIGERSELRYGIFSYRDDYLDIHRTDDVWGGRGSLSTPLSTRFTLRLSGTYERRKYRTEQDVAENNGEIFANYYILGAEAVYTRNWLSAFLRYERVENRAEGNIRDYGSNRYAVGLSVIYD